MRKQLEAKLQQRIGKGALTKDNMKFGIITGYVIERTEDAENPFKAKYLIAIGEGKNATLRLTDESNVVVYLGE